MSHDELDDSDEDRVDCPACSEDLECEVCGGRGNVLASTAELFRRGKKSEKFTLCMDVEPTSDSNGWRWIAYRKRAGWAPGHWEVVAESRVTLETEHAAERDAERARPGLVRMLSAELGMGFEDGLGEGPGLSEFDGDEFTFDESDD